MKKSLALLTSAVAFAVAANAQCFNPTGTSVAGQLLPVSTWTVDDEGETPDIAFNGFTFPLGGVNWTHFTINSNGEIYLTDGTGTVGRSTYGVASLSSLRGVAGDSPRIVAFGGDNEGVSGLVGWDILLDDTVANQVKISWTGMRQYAGSQNFGMSVTLSSGGTIEFAYSDGDFGTPGTGDIAGVSAGNGVGTGSELSSDLNGGGDTGTLELVYQNTWSPWDLDDTAIFFAPNGTGGFTYLQSCGGVLASNTPYGMGCYDPILSGTSSVYQEFPTSAAAETTLENMAFQYVPTGTGGQVLMSTTAALRPVTNATPLAHSDDSFVTVTPSMPFQFLGLFARADLAVCSNGFVAVGVAPSGGTFACTSVSSFNSADAPCYVAYGEDLNPAATGSGQFYYEEDNGVVYITADAVQHYSTVDYQTHQYQFDLASGVVTIVYGNVGNLDTDNVLFGYTPGLGVPDMGGIDLTLDLPFTIDAALPAITLSQSVLPISTSSAGSLLSYQVDSIPEAYPSSGQFITAVVLSFASVPAGLDLTFMGMPGCYAYVDMNQLVGTLLDPAQWNSMSQAIPLNLPPNVPLGLPINAQAAAIATGQNALGVVSSNAVTSLVGDH